MIGATLDLAIVVTMILLIAYPSAIAIKDVLHERHARRVRVARRERNRGARDR